MQYAKLAQQVQSRGRGDDTVLIHMTPNEVGGLQALALASGGTLTRNPDTGLLEAGWLGKLLPTILGVVGAAFGIPTWAIGLGGAAAGTAATGDLGKGLMAGLQAFGGASLGGALGVGGKLGNVGGAFGGASKAAGATGAAGAAGNAVNVAPHLSEAALQQAASAPVNLPQLGGAAAKAGSAASKIAPALNVGGAGMGMPASEVLQQAAMGPGMTNMAGPMTRGGLGGFFDKFAAASREGMPAGAPGFVNKFAPHAAGLGVLSTVSNLSKPGMPKVPEEENKFGYTGPYTMAPRRAVYPQGGQQTPTSQPQPDGSLLPSTSRSSAEHNYFPDPIKFLDSKNQPYTPGQVTTPTKDDKKKKKKGFFAEGGMVPGQPQGQPMMLMPMQGNNQQGFNTNSPVNQMPTPTQTPSLGTGSPYPSPPAYGQQRQGNNPNGLGEIKGLPALARGGQVEVPGMGLIDIPDFSGMDFSNLGFAASESTQPPAPPPAPPAHTDVPSFGDMPVPDFSHLMPDFTGGMGFDGFGGMQPPAPPASPTASPTAPPAAAPPTMPQMIDIPGVGQFPMPDLSGIDFSGMQGFPTPQPGGMSPFGQPAPTAAPPAAPPAPTFNRPPPRQMQQAPMPKWASASPSALQMPTAPRAEHNFFANRKLPSGPQAPAAGGIDWNQIVSQLGKAGPPSFAAGGAVNLQDGSFVVDARTVSEIGNGSSSAGMEFLSKLGGMPITGGGDGVSDSIPAMIDGRQEARVARDEVVFSPDAVANIGGGNHERGTKKLYAMMKQAHAARKRADRGQDTGLRKGLGVA